MLFLILCGSNLGWQFGVSRLRGNASAMTIYVLLQNEIKDTPLLNETKNTIKIRAVY